MPGSSRAYVGDTGGHTGMEKTRKSPKDTKEDRQSHKEREGGGFREP